MLLCAGLLALLTHAHAAPRSNFKLSPRVNLRYEDVIVTQGGTRWRGKILERGDVFTIQLHDLSEIAIPKDDVASVTRELHPGYLHNGEFAIRITPGVEGAFVIGESGGGPQGGAFVDVAFAYNFLGLFEPEITASISPIGPDDGQPNLQVGVGLRYYLQTESRGKAFTNTEIILWGTRQDLGLRTGPGFLWDVSPNFGLGINQGVTMLIQAAPEAVAVGYHLGLTAQGRF